MDTIILSNEYHTRHDKKQCRLLKLHLPLTISFYSLILKIILVCWYFCRIKAFTNPTWCDQSTNILKAVESNRGLFHITGLENIRNTKGPVIFISNHMSTLEAFVFPSIILPMKDLTFIVKKSLLKYPLLGIILENINTIAVTRKNPREDLKTVLQEGLKILSNGKSLVIFPQSTRSPKINSWQFNTLGIKLAKKAGVPVIPVAIKTDYWGTGKLCKDLGPIGKSKKVYLSFGEPLEIKGNGKKEHQRILSFIISHFKAWSK